MVLRTANRRDLLAACGATLASLWLDRAPATAAPTAATPKRGVNLSHWFAQSYEPLDAKHFRLFVSLEQLRQIARAGFDHVRLCVDPGILFEGESAALQPDRSAFLGDALSKIAAAGLGVVVDLHPVGGSKNELATTAGAERFVARWQRLAGHLAGLQTGPLILEVLNEPSPIEGAYWWQLQARALSAIRGAAGPAVPVIVNAGAWSGISDLLPRAPYDDANVIYTVHYYSPMLFTHQATSWSWKVAARVKDLGWPLRSAAATEVARAATSDVEAETFVHDAVASGAFSREAMRSDLDKLEAWRRRGGSVPIYVGEFGVYAKAAPREARLAWIRGAREAFAARGWGWSVWDASTSFGFYSDASRRGLDPGMMSALGMVA